MSDTAVSQLMQVAPFSEMSRDAFSKSIPLDGILKNDARILDLEEGDIIVREGDYGNSAFLIISGQALVSLKKLPAELLGRNPSKPTSWLATLTAGFRQSKFPEVRDYRSLESEELTGTRDHENGTQIFLHDIPRVLPPNESVTLEAGEIFGEISALTRSPRSATVVAKTKMQLLEIRWQGFRELLKRDPALKQHVDQLYRDNSLRAHLREVEIFRDLDNEIVEQLSRETAFQSYGSFQWDREFRSTQAKDISERILSEEMIAAEGNPADDLVLIRSGFARLSRTYGDGHQTVAYLGKGQVFGLREIAHHWQTGTPCDYRLSLRAIGYVDALRIPAATIAKLVLPNLADKLPPPFPTPGSTDGQDRRKGRRKKSTDTGLLEFLVENRFVNGTNTMVIDLDRCTRCDDCVRACASTHDNNPRFNRQGEVHDHWMIANACMHCIDPVCMIGCPTGAIGRDELTGSVTINDQTCIGCSTCANSCPYQNIQMVEINDKRGLPIVDAASGKAIQKATKCDLCHDHAGGPACQRACPHDALFRIDLSSSEDPLA